MLGVLKTGKFGKLNFSVYSGGVTPRELGVYVRTYTYVRIRTYVYVRTYVVAVAASASARV